MQKQSQLSLPLKSKDDFWQIVRGICILAVVMLHCPDGSSYAIGSIEFTAWSLFKPFICFPVAIFIFLSGYFVNAEKCVGETRTYILTRGGRLLIPFVIWSLFYSAVSIIGKFHSGDEIDWLWYAYRFVIGKAATPFYYIIVLIQLTILSPWLVMAVKNEGFVSKLLWLVTPAYLLLVYYWNFTDGAPTIFGTVFPAWFIFYYLGLNVRQRDMKWKSIIHRFGHWYVLLFAALVSICETQIWIKMGLPTSFALSQIKYSSFLYALSFIFVLLNFKSSISSLEFGLIGRLLKTIGDYSYGIFYIHCFILTYVKKVLQVIGIDSVWIFYFILTWVALCVISYIVVKACNKVLVKNRIGRHILHWVGFA